MTAQDYIDQINELKLLNTELLSVLKETALQYKNSVVEMESIYRETKALFEKELAKKDSEIQLMKVLQPIAN